MARPTLQEGWLGAQPRFRELKLSQDSHTSAEFQVRNDNSVKIKLKTGTPVKVVTKLTQCSSERDIPGNVFLQRDKEAVYFHLSFPSNGFYQFEIFALEENSESDHLPNVYNYLIENTGNNKIPFPFPKAYTKFYTSFCQLNEPMTLNKDSKNLDAVKFEVNVPGALKVAVHCVEEWFHLEQKGSVWAGMANFAKYKGKDSKVTVNASYDSEACTYNVLLEYHI